MTREVIGRKLADLDQTLARLRGLRIASAEALARDPILLWAVEHGLQIAIQTCLDAGNRLVAASGGPPAETYADVLASLVRMGAIPEALGRRLEPVPGFRNVLVHEYGSVDPLRVYEVWATRLDDLGEFARAMAAYLAPQSGGGRG
ncbi:MAG: DUF86 domain-containing protein [Planctomycetes bacterium]|nr:DUF86 domain-containing protein [Planctomycetota bacterium]